MADRNEFSLKCKVKVIDYANKNPSQSSCKIAEVFNCGCMQFKVSSRKRRQFSVNMKPMRRHLKSIIVELSLATSMKLCTDSVAKQDNAMYL